MSIGRERVAGFGGGREGGLGGPGGRGEGAGDELKQLSETLDQAERYRAAMQSSNPPKFDARLAALVPVIEGKTPLIVSATRAAQIRSAVAYAKHRQLKLVIYGGYEAMDCQELLVAEKVPVIVAGCLSLTDSSRFALR